MGRDLTELEEQWLLASGWKVLPAALVRHTCQEGASRENARKALPAGRVRTTPWLGWTSRQSRYDQQALCGFSHDSAALLGGLCLHAVCPGSFAGSRHWGCRRGPGPLFCRPRAFLLVTVGAGPVKPSFRSSGPRDLAPLFHPFLFGPFCDTSRKERGGRRHGRSQGDLPAMGKSKSHAPSSAVVGPTTSYMHVCVSACTRRRWPEGHLQWGCPEATSATHSSPRERPDPHQDSHLFSLPMWP